MCLITNDVVFDCVSFGAIGDSLGHVCLLIIVSRVIGDSPVRWSLLFMLLCECRRLGSANSPKTNRHEMKRYCFRFEKCANTAKSIATLFLSSEAVVIIDPMPLFLGHCELF